VDVGVLGPLEVVSGAARIALGGPKQRLVLGLLAAWRGRVVTVDELIDGLWPEGPQDQPRKTVQVYITRLRVQR
jgi:DNA-binding SARP family transcriptional activator